MNTQGPLAAMGAVVAAGGLVWMISSTLSGQFTIGDVSAFIAAVAGVQAAIGGMVGNATQGYEALLLFGHYVEVSDMKSELPAAKDPVPMPKLEKAIRVEDVWFRLHRGWAVGPQGGNNGHTLRQVAGVGRCQRGR